MKIVDNYESKIWLGLREGYSETYHDLGELYEEVKKYCSLVGQCVTVTPTKYIYKDGMEDGVIIGFINYPRFPQSSAEIRNKSLELAERLIKKFNQFRATVTFYPVEPNGSIMLENEELLSKTL